MDQNELLETLALGLRRLDASGRPTTEPVDAGHFEGHLSLIVLDLEMSGPNAQMHEVPAELWDRPRTANAIASEDMFWRARS